MMNTKRLLKLADFLEKLPRKKFQFDTLVEGPDKPRADFGCGSVGCAIGWAPVCFPRSLEYRTLGKRSYNHFIVAIKGRSLPKWSSGFSLVAQGFFGLDSREADGLFNPRSQEEIGERLLDFDATPKQVAALIRRFVKKNSKATK